MFSLTPAATSAIVAARSEAGAPEGWGIRFFAAAEDPPGIAFDFVDGPEVNDFLGGTNELRTYVEASVHRDIGDATVDYEDADGIVGLVIRPHPRPLAPPTRRFAGPDRRRSR